MEGKVVLPMHVIFWEPLEFFFALHEHFLEHFLHAGFSFSSPFALFIAAHSCTFLVACP